MTVYLLRCCRDGSLYCGVARNAMERCLAHNAGNGSKYVRSRLPAVLVWAYRCETQAAALKLEARIKRLSKAKKKALVLDA